MKSVEATATASGRRHGFAREAVAPARRAAYDVELAGCRIRIVSEERVRLFFADYLAMNRDGTPAFVVEEPTEEDMAREGLPDTWADRLRVLHERLCGNLLPHDILLFHGSVIAVDGKAYLFTAKSGTGKSTHTRLWREAFGQRAVMINDDKPLLRVGEGGVTAYGTPWNGKHRLGGNLSAPLKALCVLTRDERNHIERITLEDAFPMLFQQCYQPEQAEKIPRVLTLLERLGKTVGLYRLGCNMEPEAAIISYQGMQEEET